MRGRCDHRSRFKATPPADKVHLAVDRVHLDSDGVRASGHPRSTAGNHRNGRRLTQA